ncbi:molybdopterin-dependent oxidoreductase [Shewanella sp. 3B26]|uniref:Molybdopterin-dependent oxidoreductase n=1 Tax=Shewanella zhuhaiensis TaxID=2919576 RepID=A0AAJ1BK90_9GAMM|nr:molybdopterin-dependent oxidoreductase [Shewanella zhuhaiensis]
MGEVNTSCAYCGVGCGVTVAADGSSLTGDRHHSANLGRLCQKGERLLESLPLPSALRYPRLGGERIGWDDAIALMAKTFAETLAEHGPDAVALYLSGQLLTEDYYVANKLAKGFWGTANVDTNSRLCMSSAVSAHQRAFGEDLVPCDYQDLELADTVVLVGSNAAWTHPVLFQRLLRAREERGTRIVVIDPRKTATAAQADWHLALAPSSDLALYSLLTMALHGRQVVDEGFVGAHTQGLDALIDCLAQAYPDTQQALATIGLVHEAFERLLALYASGKVVTAFCQGVNQQVRGTDTINAIINCHLLLGQIGKPGCGPFSLTGQPNAMGGREVGALATQLACHMGFGDKERELLAHFWPQSLPPKAAGLTATELFSAMADCRIKAVWIMATNPLVSLPDRALVERALKTCPFVVVSDISADTDTAKHADLLLPALGWSEKSGTVTNSERTISRQRAFMAGKGEAKADWQAVCELANAMGYPGFEFASAAAIFREHAALSGEVTWAFPEKHFDISRLASLSDEAFDTLTPVRWPFVHERHPHQLSSRRLFADGRFAFKDGRARFVAPATTHIAPDKLPDAEGVWMRLNSGRSRDQWHTRTRTGHVPALCRQEWEPCLYLCSADLVRLGLAEGQLVSLRGQSAEEGAAELLLPVMCDDGLQSGQPFMSMHWTGNEFGSGVNALTSALIDPISRQPAFKSQPVLLKPVGSLWRQYAYGAVPPPEQSMLRRQRLCIDSGVAELSYFSEGVTPVPAGKLRWQRRLGEQKVLAQLWASLGTVTGFALASDSPLSLNHQAFANLIGRELTPRLIDEIEALLVAGDSPLVCLCKGVSQKAIKASLATCPEGMDRALWVRESTGCGSGCGSCVGELVTLSSEFTLTGELTHG